MNAEPEGLIDLTIPSTPTETDRSPTPPFATFPQAYALLSAVIAANAGHADAADIKSVKIAGHAITTLIPKTSFAMAMQRGSKAKVNGKFVVAGGINNTRGQTLGPATTRSVEVFDPSAREWKRLPDMLYPRFSHAVAETDGGLAVFGGADWDGVLTKPSDQVERFDLATQAWAGPISMKRHRYGCAAVGLVL